jgi:hypothetical protein
LCEIDDCNDEIHDLKDEIKELKGHECSKEEETKEDNTGKTAGKELESFSTVGGRRKKKVETVDAEV